MTSNNTPFVVDFTKKIPLLPLRDTLLFPSTAMRILVGREVSIQAIDAAHKNDDVVVLALQRDVVEEKPRLGITAGRTLVSALHAVHLEGWGDRNFTGPIQAHPSGIDANTSGICT